MNPDCFKSTSPSGSRILVILLATCMALGGCGSYVLTGRAVTADYSSADLVDPDDPRLNGTGLPGVNLELVRDPDSLGRKVVARTSSKAGGAITFAIDDFGAGFLDEEWDIRVMRNGSEFAVARVRLPFDASSKELLVTIRAGDGRERNSLGTEAERLLQQEDRKIPRDSAIFR